MPLPDKFFDSHGREVTLISLRRQEPEWAANRIRELHKQYDELLAASQQDDSADAKPCAVHELYYEKILKCKKCGRVIKSHR